MAWLGHPVTMVALAVLVINDHVLKLTHPGWATGKLSDAAGMLLAPPLLAALAGLIAPRLPVRRVAVTSMVAVGSGFTVVKLWAYGAELASAAWMILVVLGVAYLIWLLVGRGDPLILLSCLTVGALVAAPGVFWMLRIPPVTPAAAELV